MSTCPTRATHRYKAGTAFALLKLLKHPCGLAGGEALSESVSRGSMKTEADCCRGGEGMRQWRAGGKVDTQE